MPRADGTYPDVFAGSSRYKAESEAVVAKVKILSMSDDKSSRVSQVEVIEAIKGVELGQVIMVKSAMHSCAQDYDVEHGEEYFIAVTDNMSGVFFGEWKGDIDFTAGFEKIQP